MWRIAIALPLLFLLLFSAFGQPLQPGHLPSRKQVAPMTPAEAKNLAFVLDWWRQVIDARHTELAATYAAEDFIQHNPNIPTGRAALMRFFESMGASDRADSGSTLQILRLWRTRREFRVARL